MSSTLIVYPGVVSQEWCFRAVLGCEQPRETNATEPRKQGPAPTKQSNFRGPRNGYFCRTAYQQLGCDHLGASAQETFDATGRINAQACRHSQDIIYDVLKVDSVHAEPVSMPAEHKSHFAAMVGIEQFPQSHQLSPVQSEAR